MIADTIKLYENRQDVTLTTCILVDSPELLNGKKRPAVLVCPGGAYLNCSDREAEPVALRFAAMGEASLRDMANTPHLPMALEQLDEIDKALSDIVS